MSINIDFVEIIKNMQPCQYVSKIINPVEMTQKFRSRINI
jgi:hypothetical protein